MKKRNFKTILLAVIAFLALALGIATTRNVQAAELKATLSYKTYSYTDYQIKSDFKGKYGFEYATAVKDVKQYELVLKNTQANFGTAKADAFSNGDNVTVSNAANAKPSLTYAATGPINKTVTVPADWETTFEDTDYIFKGAGFTYAEVKAAVESYDNLAETKEFNPGDKIVIEAYAVVPAGVNTIQISYP